MMLPENKEEISRKIGALWLARKSKPAPDRRLILEVILAMNFTEVLFLKSDLHLNQNFGHQEKKEAYRRGPGQKEPKK